MSLIKMLIKDEKRGKGGGYLKTVGDRKGKQCHLFMDLLQDQKESLIKMIIRDSRQGRKGDYKTPRSEKCLGGWEQISLHSKVIECR